MGLAPGFWRNRRVLLTGHTGFKGAWLALWLESLGAEVTSVALPPATDPNLFDILAPWRNVKSIFADLRDQAALSEALEDTAPEIVFHLAAQALVRQSYGDPTDTFTSNVIGTLNLLEAIRSTPSVRAVLVATSDKVYANDDSGRPFRESAPLGGKDPYSASKACQEIVAACYRQSFLAAASVEVACARAGNVIGGGDWAEDRLVPDLFRAIEAGQVVGIRNPTASRPWQYVLEPLAGYLTYAQRLYEGGDLPPALNFGPPADGARPVREVIERIVARWGAGAEWKVDQSPKAPEAKHLTLDASLAGRVLDWRIRLTLDEALDRIVAWHRAYCEGHDMRTYSLKEIAWYQQLQA